MRAHVLQHVPFEGPGTIADWLGRSGAQLSMTQFFRDPALPDHRKADVVVVMGGPMSVNDEHGLPWLREEKRFLRDAISHGVPVLGVCLGAQLIASSLGCNVYPNDQKEIGWFPIQTETGVTSPLRDGMRVFHWHGETFDLPQRAERLASTPACRNQAFRIGHSVVALQFHLEMTVAGARTMVQNCRDELIPGRYVQSEREIELEPEDSYGAANAVMDQVLAGLLR